MFRNQDTIRATAILLTVTTTIMLTGCPAAGPMNPDNDTPPEIPPLTTFTIDFDDFPGEDTTMLAQTDDQQQPVPEGNWTRAALNVGIWSIILTVVLVVPVAAFAESFNHEPVAQDDGTWLWSYSVTIDGVLHTANLTAGTSANSIEWTMLITKDGEFTNFEWFNGSHNLVGSEGTWTVFRSPTDPTPFLRIDWTRSLTDETRDIRFTNIVPDGPENGGFIFHAIRNDPLDAQYDIFNQGENNLTAIEWNRENRDGRIMDPGAFGDENFRCWDEDLQNADCEE